MKFSVELAYSLSRADWTRASRRVAEEVGRVAAGAKPLVLETDGDSVTLGLRWDVSGADAGEAFDAARGAMGDLLKTVGNDPPLVRAEVAPRAAGPHGATGVLLTARSGVPGARVCEPDDFRVSHLADRDDMECTRAGRVLDGYLQRDALDIGEHFRWVFDGRTKELVGFDIKDFADFDLEAAEHESVWRPPLLNVPMLGVRGANAGTIIALTRMQFGDAPTPDVVAFDRAVEHSNSGQERSLEETAELWQAALALGDEKARFGLGYTLIDMGQYREAHEALRHYVRIDETNGWGWYWLGIACEAQADWEGAEYAYRETIRLEQEGSFETGADKVLALMPLRRRLREQGQPFSRVSEGWPWSRSET